MADQTASEIPVADDKEELLARLAYIESDAYKASECYEYSWQTMKTAVGYLVLGAVLFVIFGIAFLA